MKNLETPGKTRRVGRSAIVSYMYIMILQKLIKKCSFIAGQFLDRLFTVPYFSMGAGWWERERQEKVFLPLLPHTMYSD